MPARVCGASSSSGAQPFAADVSSWRVVMLAGQLTVSAAWQKLLQQTSTIEETTKRNVIAHRNPSLLPSLFLFICNSDSRHVFPTRDSAGYLVYKLLAAGYRVS